MKKFIKQFHNIETYFIIAVFLIALISWYFVMPLIAVITFILLAIINFTLIKNKMFYLLLALMLLPAFNFTRKDFKLPFLEHKMFIYFVIGEISILFLILLAFILDKGRKIKVKTGLNLLFLLLIITMLITFFFTPSMERTLKGVSGFIGIIALYILYSSWTDGKEKDKRDISKIIVVFGLIAVVEMFLLFLTGDAQYILEHKKIDLGWSISNNISQYMLIAIPFSIYLFIKNKNYIYLIFTVILAIGIIFTLSRATYIGLAFLVAMVLSLIVIYIIKNRKRIDIRKVLTICIGIALSLSVVLTFLIILENNGITLISYIMNRFDRLDFLYDSGRLDLFKQGIEFFKEKPVFGNGAYAIRAFMPTRSFHNSIIDVMASMGIVGLIIYSLIHIKVTLNSYQNKNLFSIVFLTAFISLFLVNMLDIGYLNSIYLLFMILPIAIIEKERIDKRSYGKLKI